MTKIDGLEIVMTKQMQKMIDKELKKRFEELKPELATRYEELLNMRNMEADQFNDGFNDARAGKLETDHPHYDLDTDNWRLGYAWGMFEPMKEKLARERQVSDALYLLLVDDPNTKLKAEQILIDIYGKCEPSNSDVSVTQDVLTDIKTGRSVENTNPDYYKDELYLDEDFRMLAKTYPADVSTTGVTTLIDYVEAVEAELARRDEIERLQAKRRWIPISEPPKVKGEYICYSKPDIFTCFFGDSWDGGLAFRSVIQPTHWMPLPPAPEIEELGAREAESRGDK